MGDKRHTPSTNSHSPCVMHAQGGVRARCAIYGGQLQSLVGQEAAEVAACVCAGA